MKKQILPLANNGQISLPPEIQEMLGLKPGEITHFK
jgi:bifunctional DNA-binding transcriptional regulator/antitoxin component of YhaV-PrlF toxin-antitoxin module